MIETAVRGLLNADLDEKVQIFPVILTDGDVPAHPKFSSFSYSPVLELDAVWVDRNGVVGELSPEEVEAHRQAFRA
jgi:hypothetical protein